MSAALLAGRYELLERSRMGGMALLFRALDRETDEIVAVKLLTATGEGNVARFEREARVLGTLDHPAIVGYRDHGLTSAGERYLVMDWIDGEDLSRLLQRKDMTTGECIRLAERLARGLAAVHEAGVVHRDIKPGNVFLPEGKMSRAKLIDFGIVLVAAGNTFPTDPGLTIGSPGYMAPEQAETGREIGPLADVYSLGCLLFRCLTGHRPFEGESPVAVMIKTVFEDPPRLRDRRPDAPPALDELLSRMMAKEPGDRPPSASEVADELAAVSPGARSGRRTPSRPAVGTSEKRLLSVVLTRLALRGEDGTIEDATTSVAEVLLERLGAMVHDFGGRLARFADGLMVVTLEGIGAAATDQSARAARCALAVREVLADAPIALATGRGDPDAPVPVGEVIDRALTLMSSGTGIRVDEVTAGLLGAGFSVHTDERGLRLEQRRPRADGPRTLLGVPTPMVGRIRELGFLRAIFDEVAGEHTASACLVTAAPGVGKSRLRAELCRTLPRRAPVEVWLGRGDPMSEGAPFSLLAPAIRHAAGIDGTEPELLQRKRLRARLARHLSGSGLNRIHAHLAELIGLGGEEERRDPIVVGDQMRRAWLDWLSVEVDAQPIVLVFEDLHWGDRPSVQFAADALRNLADTPLMVLALARPEVHDRFPDLWKEHGITEIRLRELSERASAELVRAVLGDDVASATVQRLAKRAAGNAFYLEELVRAVSLGRDDDLPETVLAMVQARLQAQSAVRRRILRAASIFGEEFEPSGVRALIGDGNTRAVEAELDALARDEVVSRHHDGRYAFRHALMREAAYASLTDEDRRAAHCKAGEFLVESGFGDAAVLAEHFERGGQPGQALGWYQRAAEHALEANDFVGAIARADHAAACGATGHRLGELRVIQAEAARWSADYLTTQRRGAEAMLLLPRGAPLWLQAAGLAAVAAGNAGDADQLVAIGNALSGASPDDDSHADYMTAIARTADRLLYLGRYEFAEALIARLEAGADHPSSADPAVRAWLHRIAAFTALFRGNPARFAAEMQRSADRFDEAGALRNACTQRGNAGYGYLQLGEHELAVRTLEAALETAERLGLHNVVGSVQTDLGLALTRVGKHDEAISVLLRAAELSHAGGNPRLEGSSHANLSLTYLDRGEIAAAEAEARRADAILVDAPPTRLTATAALARTLLAAGRPDEALEAAERANGQLDTLGGANEGQALVRLTFAESLHAAGHVARARHAIAAARDELFARADTIDDAPMRRSFLEREPTNARTLELADQWLRDVAGGVTNAT